MNLTEIHLDLLRHMLGINSCEHLRDPKPYRDYAAVTPGDPRFVELVALGAVDHYGRRWELDYYRTTPAGRAAAIASARARTLPKPKRVYRAWLELRDPCPDLTFREFLTHPYFADVRRDA